MTISVEIEDVDGDSIAMECGLDVLGSHKGAVAALSMPFAYDTEYTMFPVWRPNVAQLRRLGTDQT